MEKQKFRDEFREIGTIIDIPEDLEPHPESMCCIYRVPNKLRNVCAAAYTPQLVSIGPLHYGKSNLKAMEHYKTKYMNEFLERRFSNRIEEDYLIKFMQQDDRLLRIQRSYEETFDFEAMDRKRQDFAPMIVRDACFILELFLRNYERQLPPEASTPPEDYILRTPWLRNGIQLDLIMLENQIPYFVLRELFNFILEKYQIKDSRLNSLADLKEKGKHFNFLIEITVKFFLDYYIFGTPGVDGQTSQGEPGGNVPTSGAGFSIEKSGGDRPTAKLSADSSNWEKSRGDRLTSQGKPGGGEAETSQNERNKKTTMNSNSVKTIRFAGLVHEIEQFEEAKHFTDLVRKFMHSDRGFVDDEKCIICKYSAKELDRAGVKFVLPDNNNHKYHLADVTKEEEEGCWPKIFSCLKLQVPELKVLDSTECIMRNVMALEQFVYPCKPYICSYIFLLDQLISTVEDVDFLVDKKIVDNWLGSNEAVVHMVNKLCDQITVTNTFYYSTCDALNRHHENAYNVLKATIKRVYFKDLWTMSSSAVGLVLFIFSLVSTVSTIRNLF